MTITLNHTIVSARDKDAAARFFAEIFGLRFEGLGGHFAPVRVNDTLTLDFADAKGTIASQHLAALTKALEGPTSLFALPTPFEGGTPAEPRQGISPPTPAN